MANHFTAFLPPKTMPFLGTLIVQESECPYFEDRRPTKIAIGAPDRLSNEEFEQTLSAGMRRSGSLIYRPLCENCRKCFPLRIDVDSFKPTRSQQRVYKRCDPVFSSEFGPASLSDEKVELYRRYQAIKHHEVLSSAEAVQVYETFLAETCVNTQELRWRTQKGKLVGVGVLDMTNQALSSVYFYWDPDFADFGLGTFSVLKEIELAKSRGIQHYYLGYFVPGSPTMEYKAHFGPSEIWNGEDFVPLISKDITDPSGFQQLSDFEEKCTKWDSKRFDLSTAVDFRTDHDEEIPS